MQEMHPSPRLAPIPRSSWLTDHQYPHPSHHHATPLHPTTLSHSHTQTATPTTPFPTDSSRCYPETSPQKRSLPRSPASQTPARNQNVRAYATPRSCSCSPPVSRNSYSPDHSSYTTAANPSPEPLPDPPAPDTPEPDHSSTPDPPQTTTPTPSRPAPPTHPPHPVRPRGPPTYPRNPTPPPAEPPTLPGPTRQKTPPHPNHQPPQPTPPQPPATPTQPHPTPPPKTTTPGTPPRNPPPPLPPDPTRAPRRSLHHQELFHPTRDHLVHQIRSRKHPRIPHSLTTRLHHHPRPRAAHQRKTHPKPLPRNTQYRTLICPLREHRLQRMIPHLTATTTQPRKKPAPPHTGRYLPPPTTRPHTHRNIRHLHQPHSTSTLPRHRILRTIHHPRPPLIKVPNTTAHHTTGHPNRPARHNILPHPRLPKLPQSLRHSITHTTGHHHRLIRPIRTHQRRPN